jgi:predicted nucleic acid-binding protein
VEWPATEADEACRTGTQRPENGGGSDQRESRVIVYLDASALVKRYVTERGSRETGELSAKADVVATSLVSRAEVAAALAKAVRLGIVEPDNGRRAQRALASQWPDIAKVPVTEALMSRAEALAWDFALRGYDAVQLASALTWQEAVGAEITLATFDRQLWDAGKKAGIRIWPETLKGA